VIKFRDALFGGLYGSIAVVLLTGVALLLVRFVPALAKVSERAELVPITIWDRLILAAVAVVGGVVIAVLYALIFEFVTRRAGWLIGAAIGAGHGAVIWLGAAVIAWSFPHIVDAFPGELSLLFDSFVVIAGFLTLHIVYGAIVGRIYGPPGHSAAVGTRVKWREVHSAQRSN